MKIITRLIVGACFALPFILLSYALARAGSASPDTVPATECRACHEEFQARWRESAHGKAATDPVFKNAWEAAGQPGECLTCHTTGYNAETGTYYSESINCLACHDAASANHPEQPMAAERSAKLCGTCHQETFFEWQASAHRQEGLDCVGCHDPHASGLKTKDAASTCASCHRERSSNFAHSQHSQQGLTCADCHLAILPDPVEGHARRDHSFSVRLSTCNECHAYQMHDPAEVHPENPTPLPPDALAAVDNLSVANEPAPASPIGFAAISGLFGLGVGAVLAPWLERWYKNSRK